jgi:N-acetylated-alpha-linked acidic dipeptidase
MEHAVAYFNTDVGVAGPDFEASAVPSLKRFIREVTSEVPSPQGGTVYDAWLREQTESSRQTSATGTARKRQTSPDEASIPRIGDLGSGSDYTPFLQHAGVPSTDIGSGGKYGVYHSVFDNYAWFTKFADPTFVYEQQQARVFGLEILHMADADVLPYDYVNYAKELASYISAAESRATSAMNHDLRGAEEALLDPAGLPGRPWFQHTVFAPGEYTGYAAVVIPGVNEAIDAKDAARAQAGIKSLVEAIDRATNALLHSAASQ